MMHKAKKTEQTTSTFKLMGKLIIIIGFLWNTEYDI